MYWAVHLLRRLAGVGGGGCLGLDDRRLLCGLCCLWLLGGWCLLQDLYGWLLLGMLGGMRLLRCGFLLLGGGEGAGNGRQLVEARVAAAALCMHGCGCCLSGGGLCLHGRGARRGSYNFLTIHTCFLYYNGRYGLR
jgi:hypothetical protein